MSLDFAALKARLRVEPPELTPDPISHFGDHVLNPAIGSEWPDMRAAAVLVGIVDRPEPTVLLTTRASHLPDHAGQVAFPGGKVDNDDATPADTALREAEEEIGLGRHYVEPLGYLTPYLSRSGFLIVPVLAKIAPDHHLTINHDEVENAFEVPFAFLMDEANHHKESRFWKGAERHFYVMPYENRFIWGVSAGIIRSIWEQISK